MERNTKEEVRIAILELNEYLIGNRDSSQALATAMMLVVRLKN